MCRTSYQNLRPGQERQRATFYIEVTTRLSYKKFLGASRKNFHTSTAIAEHLQDLHARAFEAGFEQDQSPQDLLTRTCTRSCKEPPTKDLTRISRDLLTCTRSCKDPLDDCRKIFTRKLLGSRMEQMDPKTGAHILCEPAAAQWKCTLTSHKSHFMREFSGKMPRPRS